MYPAEILDNLEKIISKENLLLNILNYINDWNQIK
jgi:hypothetical protein